MFFFTKVKGDGMMDEEMERERIRIKSRVKRERERERKKNISQNGKTRNEEDFLFDSSLP
jgi:hypothetical protein